MQDRPYMQYAPGDVTARWHGGAYIELGYVDEAGEFRALDVINVWDYAKDEPRISRTLAAFQTRVDEWLAAQDDES